jgi:thiamine-phosphate pyrophosphorylase
MPAIDWSLYAIIDKAHQGSRSLVDIAEQLIEGGAGVIQLRNKISPSDEFFADAEGVRKVTLETTVPLIINDRVDIALAVHADGVHLGQEDLPVADVRRIVHEGFMIGCSVHDQAEFDSAVSQNPDYFGVGTIYTSSTKSHLQSKGMDVLKTLRSKTGLPLIAIGGIDLTNLAAVIQAGADGVAVISALLKSSDIRKKAREFVEKIRLLREQTT